MTTKKGGSKKRQRHGWLLILGILLGAALGVGGMFAWRYFGEWPRDNEVAPGGVPELRLTLASTSYEAMLFGGKATRYYGNTVELISDKGTERFENVEIKGRGNSTWPHPKSPFQIKLDEKADLLGLGKARKWILLANYYDLSSLRTAAAYKLMAMLGMENAMTGDFVELYMDDNYYGLYFMTHAVNIGKNEVDLRDPLGIVMEIDTLHQDKDGYMSYGGDYVMMKDVVAEDNLKAAETDFMTAFNKFERAAKYGNWTILTEVADMRSFAEYYLLSEMTANPDAYVSSFYMYKDGPDDAIHAGPGWDFDFALGNKAYWEYYSDMDFYRPAELSTLSDYYGDDTLFSRLMKVSEFKALVTEVWREKMEGKKAELIGFIEEQVERIAPAAKKDEERWKNADFAAEVEYLIWYIDVRYDAFEREYGSGNNYSEDL